MKFFNGLTRTVIICGLFLMIACFPAKRSPKVPVNESAVTTQQTVQTNPTPDAVSAPTNRYPMALPPVIFYTTKKDYSRYVPVHLAPDKKSILSYPGVGDVYYQGVLAYPSPLIGGFLLDNRGIDTSAAFLDYTYEAYSMLTQTPNTEELMKHILEKNPILSMYSCSCNRDTAVLNDMIRRNDFSWCIKIK
jgi:hypothetical protein